MVVLVGMAAKAEQVEWGELVAPVGQVAVPFNLQFLAEHRLVGSWLPEARMVQQVQQEAIR